MVNHSIQGINMARHYILTDFLFSFSLSPSNCFRANHKELHSITFIQPCYSLLGTLFQILKSRSSRPLLHPYFRNVHCKCIITIYVYLDYIRRKKKKLTIFYFQKDIPSVVLKSLEDVGRHERNKMPFTFLFVLK